MIQAMIFDLDGTLVQTERLKAWSYARAAVELRPAQVTEEAVVEFFKSVVGLSRSEVAAALLAKFDLTDASAQHMADFGVSTPWQAFVQLRLRTYESMIADADLLRRNQWPHNVQLLHMARFAGCKTGLATMSHCDQVERVLQILNLQDQFDFVATRDDVEHGKPDPEIYHLVARELDVEPAHCLVIEDSPTGVRAAQAAGMQVVAVTTPFTREAFATGTILARRWVVDDPALLPGVIERVMKRATVL